MDRRPAPLRRRGIPLFQTKDRALAHVVATFGPDAGKEYAVVRWVEEPARRDLEPGDRVELVYTSDEATHLRPGARGTVEFVDSLGTVHVRWDDGSRLGMVPGEDGIRRLEEP